eukprot:COSAG01_NODE_10223_length_2217_cov_1.474032_2_plen_399_part_00
MPNATMRDETLHIVVQGCAVSWTPAWFSDCKRSSGNGVESRHVCEEAKKSVAPHYYGKYYIPAYPNKSSDAFGEHNYCDYCVGLAWSTKDPFVYEVVTRGGSKELHIHPKSQPQTSDTFAAPAVCHVSIPHPPPKSLKITVNGDHIAKSMVYAAAQQPGENPRNVLVTAPNQNAPVLIDFHDVHLDSFVLGGEPGVLESVPPSPRARVQMTNVSTGTMKVHIGVGYADISTHTDTRVTVGSEGAACTSAGTIQVLNSTSILALGQVHASQVPNQTQNMQSFEVIVQDGDASVNVWSSPGRHSQEGLYEFSLYDRPANATAGRVLEFDADEMEAVNTASQDELIDVVDARVSGPGYLMMDTAYTHDPLWSNGYVGDLLYGHDMPMRTVRASAQLCICCC